MELYPPADAQRDYSPTVVKLLPPRGASVGREAVLDVSQQGRVRGRWLVVCTIYSLTINLLYKITYFPLQHHLSICLEGMAIAWTNKPSSFQVARAALHLSAARTTHRRSQRNGPASWSRDSRFYIHSSTGEESPPRPVRIKIPAMIMCSTVPSFPRLETRMTADINVILQLLQRQIAPVPPAYSTVSSGTLPAESSGQYGTGTPVLHGMYPISTIQIDSRVPTQVQESTK